MFGLQVILPAVIWCTVARKDAFLRGWATEALNLQVIWVGSFLLLTWATVKTQSGILGILTISVFELIGLYAVVCGVIGARKAWRGESWRYPFNLRMIAGN
jgi:uncharacterized Tic20 family protein